MRFAGAFDLDSHEFMPTHFFPVVYGEVGERMQELYDTRRTFDSEPNPNGLTRPDIVGDIAAIDAASIWSVKGPAAPGVIDMNRRLDVLDAMEVERQLVFPSFGFIGLLLASLSDEAFPEFFTHEPLDHRALGRDAIRAHNDWALTLNPLAGRQRHVTVVPTWDFDEMMAEAERMAVGGAGAIWIPATVPPAGTSPANPKLDAFWDLFEQYDIPVVLHLNTDRFTSQEWWDHPHFHRQRDSVLPQSAFFLTTANYVVENYLASMVIGGVFERHPRLRMGIIECGAQWLGPVVERMEMVWDHYPTTKKALTRRPIDYVVDHVRVTPFFIEEVDVYLERYPRLVDVYCFSSDYPHIEGGVNPLDAFGGRLERFGDDVMYKFFRGNGELLMPEYSLTGG